MGVKFKSFIGLINGFRKISIMTLLIVLAVVFRLTDHINGAELVDLLKGVGIAFMASNSVEHMGKTIVEWVKKKV